MLPAHKVIYSVTLSCISEYCLSKGRITPVGMTFLYCVLSVNVEKLTSDHNRVIWGSCLTHVMTLC